MMSGVWVSLMQLLLTSHQFKTGKSFWMPKTSSEALQLPSSRTPLWNGKISLLILGLLWLIARWRFSQPEPPLISLMTIVR